MGGLIEPVKIGYDRYGEMNVNLYDYGDAKGLTLGQLANAVCCRSGLALETQAIALTNRMTRHANKLKGLSEVMQGIVAGTAGYDEPPFTLEGFGTLTAREFLTGPMECVISNAKDETEGRLPESLDSPNDRLSVYTGLKGKFDSMTSESQQMMIDLQSCISRRDISFTTATSIVQALGGVLMDAGGNF